MSKEWDRCDHCRGTSKCDCGMCRVYIGSGYEKFTSGPCTVCGGEGGRYIDADTGRPINDYSSGSSHDERRR